MWPLQGFELSDNLATSQPSTGEGGQYSIKYQQIQAVKITLYIKR